jgi:hypothetical protein
MKEASPHQEQDVVAHALFRNIGLASLVVMGASLAVVVWLLGGVPHHEHPAPVPSTVGTLEQTLILAEGRGIHERASGRERLDAFEWVDRDAGVARIPIERAMDLVVARDGGAP